MLRGEPVPGNRGCRKVLEVGGKDDVRIATYRGSNDMAVVRIRQPNRGHEFIEARNYGVPNMGIHEPAGALKTGRRNIWPTTPQRTDPLVVDSVRPLRTVQVRRRELEQQIAQRGRVQDGGVEKCNGDRQWSVAHVKFLGVGGKLVERTPPSGIGFLLVAENVFEVHAAMRPDLVERYGTPFEQSDEEGA